MDTESWENAVLRKMRGDDDVDWSCFGTQNPPKIVEIAKKKLTIQEYAARRKAYENSIIFEENIMDMMSAWTDIQENPETTILSHHDTNYKSTFSEEPQHLQWKPQLLESASSEKASYRPLLAEHRKRKANNDFENFIPAKRDLTECFVEIKIPEKFLPPELRQKTNEQAQKEIPTEKIQEDQETPKCTKSEDPKSSTADTSVKNPSQNITRHHPVIYEIIWAGSEETAPLHDAASTSQEDEAVAVENPEGEVRKRRQRRKKTGRGQKAKQRKKQRQRKRLEQHKQNGEYLWHSKKGQISTNNVLIFFVSLNFFLSNPTYSYPPKLLNFFLAEHLNIFPPKWSLSMPR